MIAGQGADQPLRELPTDRCFQAVAAARTALGQARQSGAVVEQAADGSSVAWRRGVHGSLDIGPRRGSYDPWRE